MAARHQKLDFLTRLRIRELVLMGLIALTALLANLPQEYVEQRLGVSSLRGGRGARDHGHHRSVPLP